ncbi:MAG: helix-turn-helix domain-containing protein [Myxococcales bacterium]
MNFAKTESLSFEQLFLNLAKRAFAEMLGEVLAGPAAELLRRELRAVLAEQAFAKPPVKVWLSVQEAAEIAGVHEDTTRSWIHSGLLKATRCGRSNHFSIKRSDLDAFMESQPAHAPESVDVDNEVERIMSGSKLLRTGS